MLYKFTENFGQDFAEEQLDLFTKYNPELDISQHDLYEALCNSQLVGIAYLEGIRDIVGIVQVLSDKKWTAIINYCYILENYRNQGIGTMLMQGTMANLDDMPCVYVAPNDMAVSSFYKKFGLNELPRAGVLMTEG